MSKWGVNNKQVEAKEKEKEKKKDARDKQEQQKEDMKWVDDDQNSNAQLQRQQEKQLKQIEQQKRKQQNRLLYEQEMASLKDNRQPKQTTKITYSRALQVQQQVYQDAVLKKEGKDIQPIEIPQQKGQQKNDDGDYDSDSSSDGEYKMRLDENINHILREMNEQDHQQYDEVIDATGIDDALNQMQVDDKGDKHPQKRMRAAYLEYVDNRMPGLKKENPGFQRSQLLELIQKEWKTAPENPFNQKVKRYDG